VKCRMTTALVFLAMALAFYELPAAGQAVASSRHFQFTYSFTIKDLTPAQKKVRVWVPLPPSDAHQTVELKKVDGPVRLKETHGPVYGNRFLYGEIHHPKTATLEFSIVYDVTRREYSQGNLAALMEYDKPPEHPPQVMVNYLQADRLVPVTGKLKDLADTNSQGNHGPVSKAYGLYDYVFHNMRYDKTGTGWGRGDALWACDAKRGNCTDFHSLFIALVRAEHIPARFDIGFPIPEKTAAGMIPGYHCWAEFYIERLGWVPVDISEAWQNPSKHDYFFGSIDDNRVQFSTGRDITLAPPQDEGPLNYLVYPHVEVDGVGYEKVDQQFAFSDEKVTSRADNRGR
jgi:transglutaminase-like putative cysteine protease